MRTVLLYLTAGLLVLGLSYVASRTLPLATPAFREWAYHIVTSSNGGLQPFLSGKAQRKAKLPGPQPVDEDTNVDFAPLLDAFDKADISPKGFWPRRTHEVSVSVGGESKQIVYRCVIEWFSWKVADISDESVGED